MRTTLITADVNVEVRQGTVDDVPLLLTFFRSMAAFENLQFVATEQSVRAALFSDAPAARTLLAFVDGKPIGYAVYFFTFSTTVGKRGLWLEDLFVDGDFRSKGVGAALMAYLAKVALKNDCERFEWIVLDWNDRAIRFYRRLGANLLRDWCICRLEGAQVSSLAGKVIVKPAE